MAYLNREFEVRIGATTITDVLLESYSVEFRLAVPHTTARRGMHYAMSRIPFWYNTTPPSPSSYECAALLDAGCWASTDRIALRVGKVG
jgi:hypothetical protein